jgi:hypothetical protein
VKSLKDGVSIGALVIVSLLGTASAAQLTVFEKPLSNPNQEVSADFGVNRELRRAWIDVALTSPSLGEEGPTQEVTAIAVDGLYYDATRKQVLYRTGAETIVCAEDAKIFWSTYLKSTGQCLLTPRTEQRKLDDGFNIRERSVAKVVFQPLTTSAAQHAAATQR